MTSSRYIAYGNDIPFSPPHPRGDKSCSEYELVMRGLDLGEVMLLVVFPGVVMVMVTRVVVVMMSVVRVVMRVVMRVMVVITRLITRVKLESC